MGYRASSTGLFHLYVWPLQQKEVSKVSLGNEELTDSTGSLPGFTVCGHIGRQLCPSITPFIVFRGKNIRL